MALEDTIQQIQGNLHSGGFGNEASVSNGAVLPILNDLGWPVFNTASVHPQYPVQPVDQGGKKWVDFALRNPNSGKAAVFVEVKDVGKAASGESQLFGYAFHAGVPLIVLTDGREWSFYLPAGLGSYKDRRVHKLDLLEQDISECSYRFKRYLSHIDVIQGKAFENAKADYDSSNREAAINQSLPEAWRKLLENPDESLLNSLAEVVEDLCGFKPGHRLCAEFISDTQAHNPATPAQPSRPSPYAEPSTEVPRINQPATSPDLPRASRLTPGEIGPRPGNGLSREYGIDAAQSRYSETGTWYGKPSRFPLALWDLHGYIVFRTEEDFLRSPYVRLGRQLGVPNGISSIPGYKQVC